MKRRGEQHREHEGVRDAVGEGSHPLLCGVGYVHSPVFFVKTGEDRGYLVSNKDHPEQNEHEAGDEVRGMDSQGAYGHFTASEPGAVSEAEAVPEDRYEEERGSHAEGVDREQHRSPQNLPARGGNGKDCAEDGTRAEAGESVDRVEGEGRACRLSSDSPRQAGEGAEVEATSEDLPHPQ